MYEDFPKFRHCSYIEQWFVYCTRCVHFTAHVKTCAHSLFVVNLHAILIYHNIIQLLTFDEADIIHVKNPK